MQTDTKQPDAAASSASLAGSRPRSNSAKSPTKSPKTSSKDVDAEDGQKVATKLKTLDWLLTQLQSLITDIKQQGAEVKFYKMAEGTQVALTDVWVCPKHQILYSGPTCPIC